MAGLAHSIAAHVFGRRILLLSIYYCFFAVAQSCVGGKHLDLSRLEHGRVGCLSIQTRCLGILQSYPGGFGERHFPVTE